MCHLDTVELILKILKVIQIVSAICIVWVRFRTNRL